jgi:hypothetical protein
MHRGRDEPNERHPAGDITLDDLNQAATNHELDVDHAAHNIHSAARDMWKTGQINQASAHRVCRRGARDAPSLALKAGAAIRGEALLDTDASELAVVCRVAEAARHQRS